MLQIKGNNTYTFTLKALVVFKITFSWNCLALSDNRILDVGTFFDDDFIAEKRSLKVGAGLDDDVIHQDAIGQPNLLLDLAVGADRAVLDRRLVGDQTFLANKTFGSDLLKNPDKLRFK